jgi:hypothetical protein
MQTTGPSSAADAAEQADAKLSTVNLSSFGLRRDPPRPLDDRQRDYLELFDFDTLFYDVFRGDDPEEVICLGPPLLNCESLLETLTFRLPGETAAIAWDYFPPISPFQPTLRLRLKSTALAGADHRTAGHLTIEFAGHCVETRIQPNGQARFAGRRIVLTLSRDNPLRWIEDWATFNAKVHGADAIVLYDNGSTAYEIAELRGMLAGVPGIADVLVVPWRFPYGPGVGRANVQDSFYCQPGALEHARRRYCPSAKGVLNNDIDELTVVDSGVSIFELMEKSGKAALVFPGLWAERSSKDSAALESLRHSDCLYSEMWRPTLDRLAPGRWLMRTKWIVAPDRCPEDAGWGVHDLYPLGPQAARDESIWKGRPRGILYRHFFALTGKKHRRGRRLYSSLTYGYDHALARSLAIAFAGRSLRGGARRAGDFFAWLFGR